MERLKIGEDCKITSIVAGKAIKCCYAPNCLLLNREIYVCVVPPAVWTLRWTRKLFYGSSSDQPKHHCVTDFLFSLAFCSHFRPLHMIIAISSSIFLPFFFSSSRRVKPHEERNLIGWRMFDAHRGGRGADNFSLFRIASLRVLASVYDFALSVFLPWTRRSRMKIYLQVARNAKKH